MYVITQFLPSEQPPYKKVKHWYTGQHRVKEALLTGWNEFQRYAMIFNNKSDAKIVQSRLRKLVGSEKCKIELARKFSKN